MIYDIPNLLEAYQREMGTALDSKKALLEYVRTELVHIYNETISFDTKGRIDNVDSVIKELLKEIRDESH